MAVELPEPLQWVLLLLAGTRWPEADEGQLRDMADHWRKAAANLQDASHAADAAMKQALDGQQGAAATALGKHWTDYTVGKGTESDPGYLPGTITACNGMGDMLEGMANSAETAKIQIIAQLGILAFELATAEAEAPFTAGASMAEIPVFVATSREVVQQFLKKLLAEALEHAVKQAVQMAAINLLAQTIELAEGHRKSIDMKELGQNALGGAVAGATGNLLGKGVGAAGAKLGLGHAMETTAGKMVTGAGVGVGTDASTQLITTGHVDGNSLLGSGLSGGAGAGLHAGAAAAKSHFNEAPKMVPHEGIPGGGGAGGEHAPVTFNTGTDHAAGTSNDSYHGPGTSAAGEGGGTSSPSGSNGLSTFGSGRPSSSERPASPEPGLSQDHTPTAPDSTSRGLSDPVSTSSPHSEPTPLSSHDATRAPEPALAHETAPLRQGEALRPTAEATPAREVPLAEATPAHAVPSGEAPRPATESTPAHEVPLAETTPVHEVPLRQGEPLTPAHEVAPVHEVPLTPAHEVAPVHEVPLTPAHEATPVHEGPVGEAFRPATEAPIHEVPSHQTEAVPAHEEQPLAAAPPREGTPVQPVQAGSESRPVPSEAPVSGVETPAPSMSHGSKDFAGGDHPGSNSSMPDTHLAGLGSTTHLDGTRLASGASPTHPAPGDRTPGSPDNSQVPPQGAEAPTNGGAVPPQMGAMPHPMGGSASHSAPTPHSSSAPRPSTSQDRPSQDRLSGQRPDSGRPFTTGPLKSRPEGVAPEVRPEPGPRIPAGRTEHAPTVYTPERPSVERTPEQLVHDLPGMSAKDRQNTLLSLTPEGRRQLAGDHAFVDKLKDTLPPKEFARTAAHLLVDVDPRAELPVTSRGTAHDEIERMLQDPDTAAALLKAGASVHVIPRDVEMTDVGPLKQYKDDHFGGASGEGRGLNDARGSGGLHTAITEENLRGVTTTIGPDAHYTDGYSTTTHEFAHTIHLNALSPEHRQTITDSFNKKLNDPAATWPDGPRRGHPSGGDPVDNYSSRDELEYFAQASNAYLGTNHGIDPYTGQPRNNGVDWVKANEPELLPVLEKLYGKDPAALHPEQSNPVKRVEEEDSLYSAFRDLMGGDTHEPHPDTHTEQPHPEQPHVETPHPEQPHHEDRSDLPAPPPKAAPTASKSPAEARADGEYVHTIAAKHAFEAIDKFLGGDSAEYKSQLHELENYNRAPLIDRDTYTMLDEHRTHKVQTLELLKQEEPRIKADTAKAKADLDAAQLAKADLESKVGAHPELADSLKAKTEEVAVLQDKHERLSDLQDKAAKIPANFRGKESYGAKDPVNKLYKELFEESPGGRLKSDPHSELVEMTRDGKKKAKLNPVAVNRNHIVADTMLHKYMTAAVFKARTLDEAGKLGASDAFGEFSKTITPDSHRVLDASGRAAEARLGSGNGAHLLAKHDLEQLGRNEPDLGSLYGKPELAGKLQGAKSVPDAASAQHTLTDLRNSLGPIGHEGTVKEHLDGLGKAIGDLKPGDDLSHVQAGFDGLGQAVHAKALDDLAVTNGVTGRHQVDELTRVLPNLHENHLSDPKTREMLAKRLDTLSQTYDRLGHDPATAKSLAAHAEALRNGSALKPEQFHQLSDTLGGQRDGLHQADLKQAVDRNADTLKSSAPKLIDHATLADQVAKAPKEVTKAETKLKTAETAAKAADKVLEDARKNAADLKQKADDAEDLAKNTPSAANTDAHKKATAAAEAAAKAETDAEKKADKATEELDEAQGKVDDAKAAVTATKAALDRADQELAKLPTTPPPTAKQQQEAVTWGRVLADRDLVAAQYGGGFVHGGPGAKHPATLFEEALKAPADQVPGKIAEITTMLSNSSSNLRLGDKETNQWIQNFLDPHITHHDDLLTAVAHDQLPPEVLYTPHTQEVLRGLSVLEDAGLVPHELGDMMAPKTHEDLHIQDSKSAGAAKVRGLHDVPDLKDTTSPVHSKIPISSSGETKGRPDPNPLPQDRVDALNPAGPPHVDSPSSMEVDPTPHESGDESMEVDPASHPGAAGTLKRSHSDVSMASDDGLSLPDFKKLAIDSSHPDSPTPPPPPPAGVQNHDVPPPPPRASVQDHEVPPPPPAAAPRGFGSVPSSHETPSHETSPPPPTSSHDGAPGPSHQQAPHEQHDGQHHADDQHHQEQQHADDQHLAEDEHEPAPLLPPEGTVERWMVEDPVDLLQHQQVSVSADFTNGLMQRMPGLSKHEANSFMAAVDNSNQHWFAMVPDRQNVVPGKNGFVMTPAWEKYVEHDPNFPKPPANLQLPPVQPDHHYVTGAYVPYKTGTPDPRIEGSIGKVVVPLNPDPSRPGEGLVMTGGMNGCAYAITDVTPHDFTVWHFQSYSGKSNLQHTAEFQATRPVSDWFGVDEYMTQGQPQPFRVTNILKHGSDGWEVVSHEVVEQEGNHHIGRVNRRPLNLEPPTEADRVRMTAGTYGVTAHEQLQFFDRQASELTKNMDHNHPTYQLLNGEITGLRNRLVDQVNAVARLQEPGRTLQEVHDTANALAAAGPGHLTAAEDSRPLMEATTKMLLNTPGGRDNNSPFELGKLDLMRGLLDPESGGHWIDRMRADSERQLGVLQAEQQQPQEHAQEDGGTGFGSLPSSHEMAPPPPPPAASPAHSTTPHDTTPHGPEPMELDHPSQPVAEHRTDADGDTVMGGERNDRKRSREDEDEEYGDHEETVQPPADKRRRTPSYENTSGVMHDRGYESFGKDHPLTQQLEGYVGGSGTMHPPMSNSLLQKVNPHDAPVHPGEGFRPGADLNACLENVEAYRDTHYGRARVSGQTMDGTVEPIPGNTLWKRHDGPALFGDGPGAVQKLMEKVQAGGPGTFATVLGTGKQGDGHAVALVHDRDGTLRWADLTDRKVATADGAMPKNFGQDWTVWASVADPGENNISGPHDPEFMARYSTFPQPGHGHEPMDVDMDGFGTSHTNPDGHSTTGTFPPVADPPKPSKPWAAYLPLTEAREGRDAEKGARREANVNRDNASTGLERWMQIHADGGRGRQDAAGVWHLGSDAANPDVSYDPATGRLTSRLDPTTLNDRYTGVVGAARDLIRHGMRRDGDTSMDEHSTLSGGDFLVEYGRRNPETQEYWATQDTRVSEIDAFADTLAAEHRPLLDVQQVDGLLPDHQEADQHAANLLQQHDGFVLGENHRDAQTWSFLTERMPELSASGVRTVYLEHFRDDALQAEVTAFMGGGAPSLALTEGITRHERHHGLPQGSVLDTLTAARQHNVDVRLVDGYPARRPQPPVDGPATEAGAVNRENYQRARRMNAYTVEAIRDHQAQLDDGAKYVVVLGAAHVGQHQAPPGLPAAPGVSESLGVPGVAFRRREDGPEGAGGQRDVALPLKFHQVRQRPPVA